MVYHLGEGPEKKLLLRIFVPRAGAASDAVLLLSSFLSFFCALSLVGLLLPRRVSILLLLWVHVARVFPSGLGVLAKGTK